MSSKMLIDASHPEETRVVVLKGQRVEEFDFESANKKQLRGNIYLAKVTRVEPSLQAAFVEYGGNRHGFLAFSEIHPDYYQIPHADRQAILEEEARAHREEEDEPRGNGGGGGGNRRSRRHRRDGGERAFGRRDAADERISEPAPDVALTPTAAEASSVVDEGPEAFDGETDAVAEAAVELAPAAQEEAASEDAPLAAGLPSAATESEAPEVPALSTEGTGSDALTAVADGSAVPALEPVEAVAPVAEEPASDLEAAAMLEGGSDSPTGLQPGEDVPTRTDDENGGHEEHEDEVVEQIGGDALEESSPRRPRPLRHYKIQEVIKRRQILLVQVVKEERGNKGAALTTYLSLAGRYSVLMPNTARGGGISRKITDSDDRRRLKAIAQELDVPEGMGIILRTAGAARSQVEVTRDFEYLLRMWESVRELTLRSTAPTLVYEEGSLIKRSIRDLYTRDVEDVVVAGDEGFREARDFMQMLIPSAAKNVQLYRDSQPIFARWSVEAQLDGMFSNHVTLRSGGYIVINQTEALVAIDVNSGRSTREHNIEDTALRTNLEAADEVARQLRLRDLAGLIVVDFIDMDEGRNNRAVERRIKEALKNDRARIQIGRISHFGLLEMSRQRIRTGVLEGSTVICPHCAGSGSVRSTASVALHVLRLIEDALIRDASHDLIVRTRTEVALYILNQKRAKLADLEAKFGVSLTVAVDPTLTGMIYHAIERGEPARIPVPAQRANLVRVDSVAPIYDDVGSDLASDDVGDAEDEEADEGGDAEAQGEAEAGQGEGGRRRRRRRRRRGGRERGEGYGEAAMPQAQDEAIVAAAESADGEPDDATIEPVPSYEGAGASEVLPLGPEPADAVVAQDEVPEVSTAPADEAEAAEAPRRRRPRRSAKTEPALEPAPDAGEDDAVAAPKRRRSRKAPAIVEAEDASASGLAARPSADRDVGADTVEHHPAADDAPQGALSVDPLPLGTDQADAARAADAPDGADETPPMSSTGTAPAEPADAAPAPSQEPPRPKRSGWWQRAKATFGS